MDTKERILMLLQFLKDHTDEDTAVSNSDLRAMLRDKGESVSLPTLRDDISSLRRCGYDIDIHEINGVGTYYKFLGREWSLPELQILIDAISSSQFLSEDKTRKIIDKLRLLAGPSERADLMPSILAEQQLKAPNEQILYIVQTIKDAIRGRCRITFLYDEYTSGLNRVPKHDGYRYEVSPYAMIWKKDRYYLVGWSEKHNCVASFRIDRMEMPKITRKKSHPAPPDLHLEKYSDRVFSFFDGPEETVTLRFCAQMINHIVDKFGTNIKIRKYKKDSFEVSVPVHISPVFYGWLFQYVGEMTIVSPENVCEEYYHRLKTAISCNSNC